MFDMKLNRLLIAIGLCLCGVAYAQDLSMVIDKKGRVGFADSSGKQVIKCIYESARPFADGYAIVMKSGKYGIIDTKGKVVLPLKFNSLTSWNEELYLAKSGKVSGLVNKQGKIVLPAKYSLISKPNCYGKALIAVGGKATVADKKTYMANAKYGVIDNHGKILVQPAYKGLYEFTYEGSAAAFMHEGKFLRFTYHFTTDTLQTDCSYLGVDKTGLYPDSSTPGCITATDIIGVRRCGIIDASGKVLIKPGVYDCVMEPSSGMVRYYMLKSKSTLCGYHNLSTGKAFQVAKFDSHFVNLDSCTHGDFVGEIAPVNGASWSFIDKSGKSIRNGYEQIKFGNHLNLWAAQTNNGTWDVFDIQNNDVPSISGYNDIAFPMQKGDQELFSVKKGMLYGAINRQGNAIIPFEYDMVWANSFDVVPVKKNGQCGALSANNQQLVPMAYSMVYTPSERSSQHLWVMKSDSLYYHYNTVNQHLNSTGYRAVTSFIDGIAMVTPVDLIVDDTPVNRSQLFHPNASAGELAAVDMSKQKDYFGLILRAEDDTILFDRPVSTLYLPAIVAAIKANGDKPLSDFAKKDLLLELTKANRSYELQGGLNDKISSFLNSTSTKKSKADMKQKAKQFMQDYATELKNARLNEDEWNY